MPQCLSCERHCGFCVRLEMGHAGVTILFWWTRGEVYVWQNRAEILSLHRHGHKVSFWSVAIESRGDSFQNDNGAIIRSPFKNSALCCFFTAFDSPHIIFVQKQKRYTFVYLFYFWWTRRVTRYFLGKGEYGGI